MPRHRVIEASSKIHSIAPEKLADLKKIDSDELRFVRTGTDERGIRVTFWSAAASDAEAVQAVTTALEHTIAGGPGADWIVRPTGIAELP